MPFPARRPTTLTAFRLLAGAVALATVAVLAPPATADGAERPRVKFQSADEKDDLALDRAEKVLAEGEEPGSDDGADAPASEDGAGVDASMALRDLFLARPALEGDDALRAESLLARPSDSNDPFGNSYAVPSSRRCGPHVCVHFVERTADAPPNLAWVDTTVQVMENVWRHHVDRLGYREPRDDGGRGGDSRFDVYLKEIGDQGLYGYCAPERRVAGEPRQAASYCVLDDDFAASQFGRAPMKTLRVTAAHEFFHAIQYSYDIEEDLWLLESTATWMEEKYADDVNDNRAYLPYGQVKRPGGSLDFFNPNGFEHYGNWPFWSFVTRRYGVSAVRRVFRQVGTGGGLPNRYSVAGLQKMLDNEDGFTNVVTAYFGANALPDVNYAEGGTWPRPGIARAKRLRPASRVLNDTRGVNHLASQHVRVNPSTAFGPHWRLGVRVDAPPSGGRYTAYLSVLNENGSVYRRRVPLNALGDGSVTTPFSDARVVHATVTLVNSSSRYNCDEGSTYACHGASLDDREQFTVRLGAYRR